jgi:hypothetical protein
VHVPHTHIHTGQVTSIKPNQLIVVYCLHVNPINRGRGKELGINFGAHEEGSSGGAANQIEPDRSPSKLCLQRTDRKKSDGCSDGTTSIDETCHGTERLIVTEDRWVRCKISSDSRSDNVIGTTFAKKRQRDNREER